MRLPAVLFCVPLLLAPAACSAGEPAAVVPPRVSGTTPPAGKPPAARPGRTAPTDPYAVGVRTLRMSRGDRPLKVTVWYPAQGSAGGDAQRNAPAAQGSFPVVLFSHGLGGAPADYASLLVRWAAAGFVVAAPAYPHTRRGAPGFQALDVLNQPADASYVLTQLLDGKAGEPLRAHLDRERVAAAGHSAGGITTIGLFTIARDDRLDAGVVLAGSLLGLSADYTGAPAPMLFVHGTRDDVVSYASGKAAYEAVPWPKALLTLPNAGHRGVLPGAPEFRAVANATVEFLRWSLYGDPAAKRRLRGDAEADGAGRLESRL
jgi:fermentation-respiration switch protein FrsA (DUF1100 family)